MIDVPETSETYRHKPELGRLTTRGRSTDDGSWTTLLLIHQLDGSWTIHGLGAGVTVPAAEMTALASAILGRAPVSARSIDKWRDVDDTHIPDRCRVEQVGVAKLHGALPSRMGKLGRVVGRGFTRVHVQFDGEADHQSAAPSGAGGRPDDEPGACPVSGNGRAVVAVETDPVSAPLPAGHHETEPDRLTEMDCSTEDGPGWLHLLVADDAIAEPHHMTLCGAVLASSELPRSLCLDDCKRDHVCCLACIRAANKHNWNSGVDVDCPPGVIVRTAR